MQIFFFSVPHLQIDLKRVPVHFPMYKETILQQHFRSQTAHPSIYILIRGLPTPNHTYQYFLHFGQSNHSIVDPMQYGQGPRIYSSPLPLQSRHVWFVPRQVPHDCVDSTLPEPQQRVQVRSK